MNRPWSSLTMTSIETASICTLNVGDCCTACCPAGFWLPVFGEGVWAARPDTAEIHKTEDQNPFNFKVITELIMPRLTQLFVRRIDGFVRVGIGKRFTG